MALGLIVTTNVTVLADPLADAVKEKKAQQQQLRNVNNAVKEAEEKIEKFEHAIQMLDFKIEKAMIKLKNNETAMDQAQEDIDEAKAEVNEAELDITERQELYDKRMRAAYKSGGSQGYIQMLLGAKDFSDFISRIEAINKIAQFDKKIIGQLEESKQVLVEKETNLQNKMAKLEEIKVDTEKQLAQMKTDKDEQAELIVEAEAERRENASKLYAIEEEIDKIQDKIIALREAAPKYVPSRGSAPISSNSLVVYASNFMGTPYRWGGTTPSGFDCSGFMKYVFAHFGVNLPRTSDSQFGVGQRISRDSLQPGDLVFFGAPGNPHHVGMYVGDNCYIHSPQTGDVVKISAMTRRDFIGGRRVN